MFTLKSAYITLVVTRGEPQSVIFFLTFNGISLMWLNQISYTDVYWGNLKNTRYRNFFKADIRIFRFNCKMGVFLVYLLPAKEIWILAYFLLA